MPLFIAHRGESYLAPENTLAAFGLAWELGDEAIELDVHLTKDEKIVVCHDEDTGRVTAGKHKLVLRDSTLAQLQQLDVGSWKDARYAGEKMPRLEEVLEQMPPGKQAFVEIKPLGDAIVEAVILAIRDARRPINDFTMISFHDATVVDVKRRCPDGPKACLLSGLSKSASHETWQPTIEQLIARARACRADGLDVQNAPVIDAKAIEAIHRAGFMCHIWTEDDPTAAKRFIANGVDGVTTNRARWLRDACWKT